MLVVEDEARLAAALRRGLQAEGFAVDVAGDGQEGLELARHGGYDAMILDVMLPRLSGYRAESGQRWRAGAPTVSPVGGARKLSSFGGEK